MVSIAPTFGRRSSFRDYQRMHGLDRPLTAWRRNDLAPLRLHACLALLATGNAYDKQTVAAFDIPVAQGHFALDVKILAGLQAEMRDRERQRTLQLETRAL